MKTYLYLSVQLMVIVLFANFLVEFLTEGTIDALLEKPLRLFGATILIGLIGAFVLVKEPKKRIWSNNKVLQYKSVSVDQINLISSQRGAENINYSL